MTRCSWAEAARCSMTQQSHPCALPQPEWTVANGSITFVSAADAKAGKAGQSSGEVVQRTLQYAVSGGAARVRCDVSIRACLRIIGSRHCPLLFPHRSLSRHVQTEIERIV